MTEPDVTHLAQRVGISGPWERARCGLNVVWLGPDVVIKLYRPHDAKEARIERDALIAVTGRVPSPVPEVLDQGHVDGWTWLALRRLPGRTASSAWGTLSPGAKLAIGEAAGEWLAAMHAIPAPPSVAERCPDFCGWLTSEWATTRVRHLGEGLPPGIVEAIPGWITANGGLPNSAPRFIHADLHDENLLIDDQDRVCGVLDLGDAMVGPVLFDLVPPVVHLARGDAGVLRALLAGAGLGAGEATAIAHLALIHPWAELAPWAAPDLGTLVGALCGTPPDTHGARLGL